MADKKHLVVVGSANADIYLEIQRLPLAGETISASAGRTLPGGKGANQAACGARLGLPTYFLGQVCVVRNTQSMENTTKCCRNGNRNVSTTQ